MKAGTAPRTATPLPHFGRPEGWRVYSVRAATPMRGCRPRRDVRSKRQSPTGSSVPTMKNMIAPLTFTVAAVYVIVLFVLAHSTP